MKITKDQIDSLNAGRMKRHSVQYSYCKEQCEAAGIDMDWVTNQVAAFEVAIPSWALGAGGTRFGRFQYGGEPGNLYQKIEDIGVLHALSGSAGEVSLHIPWDIPEDTDRILRHADQCGIGFNAMNSNTFQDQPGQSLSYKYGSLCHVDAGVRRLAVQHNKEVIDYGVQLGSKSLTVWLADGSNFPGQLNFRRALQNTLQSLREIYDHLPADWSMFIEYKPYEPNFYSMVIPDWGTSHFLANRLGEQAFSLVDLGHHLPNTNIEQIVATLMMTGKLGGFHFNDSKYGDDDLTVGSIKPYQLFLIFNELVYGFNHNESNNPVPAWMIDASHNVKDPLEDLLQSLHAIETAYAKALLVDQVALEDAQSKNDVVAAERVLHEAFQQDVRPILAEARKRRGAAMAPVEAFRALDVRNQLIRERGSQQTATGL